MNFDRPYPRLLTVSALLSLVALGGCATTDDPSEGGFFEGVSGIASGSYEAGIETQQDEVAAAEARNAALGAEQGQVAGDLASVRAEIAALERDMTRLKFDILQKKNALGPLPPALNARVQATLNAANPTGTDSSRLAALRRSVANARALSAELTQLAG
jgi:chromosome segregation ATPase